MPKSDQGVNAKRYTVIPRTLIFVTRGSEILLLKGAPTKRLWANRYNGIGGHVERGENILAAAKRELLEETGLSVQNLQCCGTIVIDASDDKGILIFIFRGEYESGDLVSSEEGSLMWVRQDQIIDLPLVEDLYVLLPKVIQHPRNARPFWGRSYYSADDHLVVDIQE